MTRMMNVTASLSAETTLESGFGEILIPTSMPASILKALHALPIWNLGIAVIRRRHAGKGKAIAMTTPIAPPAWSAGVATHTCTGAGVIPTWTFA